METYSFSTKLERGVQYNVVYHTHCVWESRCDTTQDNHNKQRLPHRTGPDRLHVATLEGLATCLFSFETMPLRQYDLHLLWRAIRFLHQSGQDSCTVHIAFSFIVVGRRYTHHGGQLPECLYSLVPRRETEMVFRFNMTTETTTVATRDNGQVTCSLYHQ